MSLEESSHNANHGEKSTGRARDWKSFIAEWESSDLSQKNFCQQHNLWTLDKYKRNNGKRLLFLRYN